MIPTPETGTPRSGPARVARRIITASLAALIVFAGPPQAAGQDEGAGKAERGSTFWAHPAKRAPIREKASAASRVVAPTHLKTEDGFSEVYLVFGSRTDSDGHTWLHIRIPMRPNGRTGWVRASTLGPLYRVSTRLVVDRSEQRAILSRNGRKIWSAPVGVGKPNTPTPAGHFWIREKFEIRDSSGIYGPRAFGTSDYSVLTDWPGGGVIGIHGTDEPSLIPGRPSHGCIRVKNADIKRLYRLMGIGTPVLIK